MNPGGSKLYAVGAQWVFEGVTAITTKARTTRRSEVFISGLAPDMPS